MLRVGGGKDQGTRFLTFVDAMLGFKHLLTQEDLDKAASMCQGLKGHLKSRFLVLSDDRQPPVKTLWWLSSGQRACLLACLPSDDPSSYHADAYSFSVKICV